MSNINVKEEYWPLLLKFAEKNHLIDYRFLLEIYRGRKARMDAIVWFKIIQSDLIFDY